MVGFLSGEQQKGSAVDAKELQRVMAGLVKLTSEVLRAMHNNNNNTELKGALNAVANKVLPKASTPTPESPSTTEFKS